MKTVAVSGGFDPVHTGHINLLREAKALGDRLVVILNNDNWLRAKKGSAFMDQNERAEILRAIRYVDEVVISSHPENPEDMSICAELEKLKPDIFANGGDRWTDNIPEAGMCRNLNIKTVDNVGGGKTQSSTELVRRAKAEK